MRDRTISIVSVVAILTIFFSFWKIAGMPPGSNGDYLDVFDDAVAGAGMAAATLLLLVLAAVYRSEH